MTNPLVEGEVEECCGYASCVWLDIWNPRYEIESQ